MSGLVVVTPVIVTPAMLVDTDVPENDHVEWDVGTTYADGDRVIVSSAHKIFESLLDANTGKDPLTNASHWIEVSATNRWKAFDLSVTTRTAKSGSMYFEITPGRAINAAAVLNMVGVEKVRYRLTDPIFGLVYDREWDVAFRAVESTWYSWIFGWRIEFDQSVDMGIPSYPDATLRVDLTGLDNMAIGVLLIGGQKNIGDGVLQGVSVGIQDYSRKEPNDFGDVVLVQRAFSKRATFPVLLDNKQVDNTQSMLASIRATPCLWIGGKHSSMTVYGFYKDFEILFSYHSKSDCSIEIEGLT